MVTRLGLYGGPRSLYGSFAGKTEQEIVVAVTKGGGVGSEEDFYALEKRQMRELEKQRHLAMLVADDEEILALL